MSGMDVSLGGVMAGVPLLKVLWAGMFALGIDTAFALSWVRVRQCVTNQQWVALLWNMLLALAMSVVVFQPLAIQLLQQSLNMSFDQAVASLGINLVFLTYARSGVAIFLGAILAMTNVEHATTETVQRGSLLPKRRVGWLERLRTTVLRHVSSQSTLPGAVAQSAPVTITEEPSAPANAETDPPPAQAVALDERIRVTTPQERAQKVSEFGMSALSAYERVATILALFPGVSDRELGKLSGLSAATAKKHKGALTLTPPDQAQVTEESNQ